MPAQTGLSDSTRSESQHPTSHRNFYSVTTTTPETAQITTSETPKDLNKMFKSFKWYTTCLHTEKKFLYTGRENGTWWNKA